LHLPEEVAAGGELGVFSWRFMGASDRSPLPLYSGERAGVRGRACDL
jgi:hypothetical protein